MSRRGHVYRQANTPIALQLANSAVWLCNQTCRYVIKLWSCRLHFPVNNMRIFICRFYNDKGSAAVEEYRWRFPRRRVPGRGVFSNVHRHGNAIGILSLVSCTPIPLNLYILFTDETQLNRNAVNIINSHLWTHQLTGTYIVP